MLILIYILFILYPSFSDFKDAILWSGKSYNAVMWDIHYLFIAERVVFGLSVLASAFFPLWDIVVALGCMVLSFPFFHNGFYYWGRGVIDGSHEGWTSSPAGKWNINWTNRSIMFGLSLLILIGYEIIY